MRFISLRLVIHLVEKDLAILSTHQHLSSGVFMDVFLLIESHTSHYFLEILELSDLVHLDVDVVVISTV